MTLEGKAQNWRTPSDPTKRGGSQPEAKRREAGHTVNLEDQAEHQNWPTARGRFDSGQHRGSGDSLHSKVKQWPTAVQQDQGNLSEADFLKRKGRNPDGAITSLNIVASNWQTPHGMAGVDRAGKRGGPGGGEFGMQAGNWATPRAGNPKSRIISKGGKIIAQQAEEFHTPHQAPDLLTLASRTSSNFSLKNLKRLRRFLKPSEAKPSAGSKSSKSGPGSRRRLNPVFVEWLMGLPLLWTQPAPSDCERSETPEESASSVANSDAKASGRSKMSARKRSLGIPPASKAIRLKCKDCSGGSESDARNCVVPSCPLWPYRMGRGPKEKDLRVPKFDRVGILVGHEDWAGYMRD
jgi:hypothetical protein